MNRMPDGEGGGGGGGGAGEGAGRSECLPMDDLVQAMLTNAQALAEALAADRARREAADRVQRESWGAALREKDAEIGRLRAEAADAKKKLQADASRKARWEAAYELLLGANQKLAELRDADMEDSRTCAETPNSKEVESCTKLSQNTMDHSASDFRKLKQAYEKDKEISALLSEKDSLRSQLDIVQKDYAELLKNKGVEAAQAAEAALKLQQSVDDLKALAGKKDDEIGRLQAKAVGAKKKHAKDLSALVSEKNSINNQLRIMQQNYAELLKNKKEILKSKKVLTQKKDHEIVILRAEVVGAKKKAQQMHSLVKEKDAEIQKLKGCRAESVRKHYKDISETHKKSRSIDPAVTTRDKLENSNLRQTVEEDYISETKTVEKDGQGKTTQKRTCASSMSNDCEMSGSDEDADKQSESDKDGDKQSESDEDGDEQSTSGGGGDDDDDGQSKSDEHEHSQSGSDKETTNNPILKPHWNHKRKRDACNAEATNRKSHSESNGSGDMSETKTVGKDGQEKTTQKRRQASSMSNDDEKSRNNEDDDEQIGSDEDGEKQSESDEDGDKQSGSDEDGDEQSGSDEDGDDDDDNEKNSGSDEERAHIERMRWSWMAPAPLRQKKLIPGNGRRYYRCTGHWGQYVKAVNDSLIDQPDKHKEFLRFMRYFTNWRVREVARTMKVILDGQPKLIRQFNQFLPDKCQIWVKEEEEEKQQPKVEEPKHQPGVPRPSTGQLPSSSAAAAAGLIKLKEAEQRPKWGGKLAAEKPVICFARKFR